MDIVIWFIWLIDHEIVLEIGFIIDLSPHVCYMQAMLSLSCVYQIYLIMKGVINIQALKIFSQGLALEFQPDWNKCMQ